MMKKFLQIYLLVALIFVPFQAVIGEVVTVSMHSHIAAASQISFPTNMSPEAMQMAACLVSTKGMTCVKPNVGWNS